MTFKRHFHEDGLTEAEYDFLLPVSDPVTTSRGTSSSGGQNIGTRSITKETQTGTTYQTPPPVAEAFGVLELAEQIFLQLPPENLLCKVQRVCRRWHEIVQNSGLVRECLFFKPIKRKKPRDFLEGAEGAETWSVKGTPEHYIENPWLYLFSPQLPSIAGSWQRMLVAQPPIHTLKYSTFSDYAQQLEREMEAGSSRAEALEWMCISGDRFQRLFRGRGEHGHGHKKGMRLCELYIAAGWGKDWKPMLGCETIRRMKKVIRLDEDFLEIQLADELHWTLDAL